MSNPLHRRALIAGLLGATCSLPAATAHAAQPKRRRLIPYPTRPTFADVRARLSEIRNRLRWGNVNDGPGVARLRRDVEDLTATVEQLVAVLDQRPMR